MLQVFSDMIAAAALQRRPPSPALHVAMEAADAAWLAERRARRATPCAIEREAEGSTARARREAAAPRPLPRRAPKPLRLSLGA